MAKTKTDTTETAEIEIAPPVAPEAKVAPGTIPNRVATVFTLPEWTKIHYSDAFPDMCPKPVDGSPGVWAYDDGTPYVPRERRGGQFSAALITTVNKITKQERRYLLTMDKRDAADEYGVPTHERITKREEVIFDFEDQMHEALAAMGARGKRDPLADKMRARGFSYDDPATTPGMAYGRR